MLKERFSDSDCWVQVRPKSMKGEEMATVIVNETKSKQEMRAIGRGQSPNHIQNLIPE